MKFIEENDEKMEIHYAKWVRVVNLPQDQDAPNNCANSVAVTTNAQAATASTCRVLSSNGLGNQTQLYANSTYGVMHGFLSDIPPPPPPPRSLIPVWQGNAAHGFAMLQAYHEHRMASAKKFIPIRGSLIEAVAARLVPLQEVPTLRAKRYTVVHRRQVALPLRNINLGNVADSISPYQNLVRQGSVPALPPEYDAVPAPVPLYQNLKRRMAVDNLDLSAEDQEALRQRFEVNLDLRNLRARRPRTMASRVFARVRQWFCCLCDQATVCRRRLESRQMRRRLLRHPNMQCLICTQNDPNLEVMLCRDKDCSTPFHKECLQRRNYRTCFYCGTAFQKSNE